MTVLTTAIILAMLTTAGALLWGIGSMARGGKFDRHHSYKFMFARVGLQGVTLLLLLIALFAATR